MSKQEKVVVNKGATKVASGISKVLGDVAKQGNIITQCVSAVNSVYRGAEVPKADLSFIANKVAQQRNWSEASAGPRKSEVRKIIRAYREIPEAVKLYTSKHSTFTWHTCMRLVTQLNKKTASGKPVTVRAAVHGMVLKSKDQPTDAMKSFKLLISRIENLQTRSPKIIGFRRDLVKLLDKHNLS